MDNKEIAELTTRIVEAVAGSSNQNIRWDIQSICACYEEMFKTIKQMDQENK